MSALDDMLAQIDIVIAAWLAGDPLNKWFNYRIGDYRIDKTTTLDLLLKLRKQLIETGETKPVEEISIYDDPDI